MANQWEEIPESSRYTYSEMREFAEEFAKDHGGDDGARAFRSRNHQAFSGGPVQFLSTPIFKHPNWSAVKADLEQVAGNAEIWNRGVERFIMLWSWALRTKYKVARPDSAKTVIPAHCWALTMTEDIRNDLFARLLQNGMQKMNIGETRTERFRIIADRYGFQEYRSRPNSRGSDYSFDL